MAGGSEVILKALDLKTWFIYQFYNRILELRFNVTFLALNFDFILHVCRFIYLAGDIYKNKKVSFAFSRVKCSLVQDLNHVPFK